MSQRRRFKLDGISAEIIEDRRNNIIGRRELRIRLEHIGSSTPKRTELRTKLADALGVAAERVIVRSLESTYGVGASLAEVHVYDTPERLKRFEPEYVLKRNEV